MWLALKNYDPRLVGFNFDLAHILVKSGTGWWDSIRLAHKHMLSVAVHDFKWVKRSDPVRGMRRTDPSPDWPWTAEYVAPGQGMVNFKSAFEYLKSINFSGPIYIYFTYWVDVPGLAKPLDMWGGPVGQFQMPMTKSQYLSYLRRDRDFFESLMKSAGLL